MNTLALLLMLAQLAAQPVWDFPEDMRTVCMVERDKYQPDRLQTVCIMEDGTMMSRDKLVSWLDYGGYFYP